MSIQIRWVSYILAFVRRPRQKVRSRHSARLLVVADQGELAS
jgi:hypothetical protein